MPRKPLKKEKWTLSFDARLKALVVKEADRRGVYPVSLLEEIVRNEFNPYGHTEIRDSPAHVRAVRRKSREISDKAFLEEIRAWQKRRPGSL